MRCNPIHRFLVLAGLLAALGAAGAARAGALVDPTRPTSAAPAGPVLESTLISSRHRIAVINGRRYRVGDRLGRAVIVDIEPYEVILRESGRLIRLRLLPDVLNMRTDG